LRQHLWQPRSDEQEPLDQMDLGWVRELELLEPGRMKQLELLEPGRLKQLELLELGQLELWELALLEPLELGWLKLRELELPAQVELPAQGLGLPAQLESLAKQSRDQKRANVDRHRR